MSSDEAADNSGFQKGAFVKNIGYILVTIIGLVIAMVFIMTLGLLSRKVKAISNLYIKLRDIIFFGSLLSYILKSYLKLYINALQGCESTATYGLQKLNIKYASNHHSSLPFR
jgi:hypothetical protein